MGEEVIKRYKAESRLTEKEGRQVISQVELKMEVKRVAHLEGTTEI